MLLRNEAREKSLEMRPNYITGLPPARLRLQRERNAAALAKTKKVRDGLFLLFFKALF